MKSVCGGMAGAASKMEHTEPWTDLADIPVSPQPTDSQRLSGERPQVETIEVGKALSWCSINIGKISEGLSLALQALSGVIPSCQHYH